MNKRIIKQDLKNVEIIAKTLEATKHRVLSKGGVQTLPIMTRRALEQERQGLEVVVDIALAHGASKSEVNEVINKAKTSFWKKVPGKGRLF